MKGEPRQGVTFGFHITPKFFRASWGICGSLGPQRHRDSQMQKSCFIQREAQGRGGAFLTNRIPRGVLQPPTPFSKLLRGEVLRAFYGADPLFSKECPG